MASGDRESDNFHRFLDLIIDVGGKILRTKFDNYIKDFEKVDIKTFFSQRKHALLHIWKTNIQCGRHGPDPCPTRPDGDIIMYAKQWDILFQRKSSQPRGKGSCRLENCHCKYETKANIQSSKFDVTLCSLILLVCCPGLSEDDKQSIRIIRGFKNDLYSHILKTKMSDSVIQTKWDEATRRLKTLFPGIAKDITEVEKKIYTQEMKDKYMTMLLEEHREIEQINQSISKMEKKMGSEIGGVKKNQEDIKEHVNNTGENLQQSMTATEDKLTAHISNTGENLQQSMTATEDKLTAHVSNTGENLQQSMTATEDKLTAHVSNTGENLQQSLTAMEDQQTGKFTDIQKQLSVHTEKLHHVDNKVESIESKIDQQNEEAKRLKKEQKKKLIETTEDRIKTHLEDKTFVKTKVVDESLECVRKNGVVVLTGPPGIGKTELGLELLSQLKEGDNIVIQLYDISKWNDMSDGVYAVLFDDMFGRTNCTYDDNVHFNILEMIYASIQQNKCKVILTLRKTVWQNIRKCVEKFVIFHDQNILDLSSERYKMDIDEKKSCLMNYLTENKIMETDKLSMENINDTAILDRSVPVFVHHSTIRTILHADLPLDIGFPEACYLFSSQRKFTMQGDAFFKHPTKKLLDEILNLRKEGDENLNSKIDYTFLVYILLHDDYVNMYEIDTDAFIALMKTTYLKPLDNIPSRYFFESANRLFGKYLQTNNEGNYCFQHRLISEAVVISYSDIDPKSVIPLLGFYFITEMARPRNYKPSEGEVIFTVPKSCYGLLAQRLLQLLDVECSEGSDSSCTYSFVLNLCKSKIIKMTGNTILQEMITQYKYKEYDRYYFQIIHDHRFAGQYPYYDIFTTFFYLPVALLMFCNTDNDSIYQCLYERIHNILISESDSDVMKACQKTLVMAFNFAVCTRDVKKSTVILKILTVHNIKQENIPTDFCVKIVRNQGLPGVQLLLDLHGLLHVYNITSLLSKIFRLFNSNRITIDDNMKQFITSVIVNNNHDKSLVRAIVEYVCSKGQPDFVMEVCERFDSSLLPDIFRTFYNKGVSIDDNTKQFITSVIVNNNHDKLPVRAIVDYVCSEGQPDFVMEVCERFDSSLLPYIFRTFYYESVSIDDNTKQFITSVIVNNNHAKLPVRAIVKHVCSKGQLDFGKEVCERFDSSLLDIDYMIKAACRGSNTEVLQWLMEKYDGLYDVDRVLDEACNNGCTEGVKVILNRSDHTLLDMKSAMNKACSRVNIELVKWLCGKFDHNLFDMKTGMNEACSSGDTELVKWLCEKFDNNLFDMETMMNKACSNDDTELVKWLCEKFDNNLFYMKTGMKKACDRGDTELVKWLCEKVDNNLFDMETMMNKACSRGDTKLVRWLCENVDNNLFDMKTGMNIACRRGDTKLVRWLCENVDNNLFDMKTGMNEACMIGDTKLVKWLCERFDNNLFDMKTGMNEACSRGQTKLVKWLCEHVDNSLFDMKTVMNEACSGGNTELVKWLCKKFDNNLFDMKTLMNKACSSFKDPFKLRKLYWENLDNIVSDFDMEKTGMNKAGSRSNTKFVKWLCENVDNNLFDMKTGMNMACSSGDTELVKWLCENVDNNLFDMKTGMNMACSSGDTELVKWLCENVDNNLFDMKTGMNKACSSCGMFSMLRYNTELVKWLCENVDNNLFDMKTVMNKACSSCSMFIENSELVKWLCENVDSNLFDMKTVMNEACSNGDTGLVKWLCEKFDHNLFDMKTGMNEACSSGDTELVKWLCEKFDNNLFDMKTGMNMACSSGDTKLVKWLCEKFDNNLFDMKSAIIYTYDHYDSSLLKGYIYTMGRRYERYDKKIIDWLFDNFDTDLFDIDSADYATSRYYHIDQIQYVYYTYFNEDSDNYGYYYDSAKDIYYDSDDSDDWTRMLQEAHNSLRPHKVFRNMVPKPS